MCKITFRLCVPFMGLRRPREIISLCKRLGAQELQDALCTYLVSKLCSSETSGPCPGSLRGVRGDARGAGRDWAMAIPPGHPLPLPFPLPQLAEGQQKASFWTPVNLCLPVLP